MILQLLKNLQVPFHPTYQRPVYGVEKALTQPIQMSHRLGIHSCMDMQKVENKYWLYRTIIT